MSQATDRITEIGGALDQEGATAIARQLRKLLADVFALYLKTKGFHWHIRGPHFWTTIYCWTSKPGNSSI